MTNVFIKIPLEIDAEVLNLLVDSENVRVEHIMSQGYTSPATGWYDQKQNEWVIALQGQTRQAPSPSLLKIQ